MKKFLSMVAALALVLTLSVSAFAAIPSVTYNPTVTTDTTVTIGDESVKVVVDELTFDSAEAKKAFEESLDAAVESLVKTENDIASLLTVDVVLVDQDGNIVNEKWFEENETLEVTFTVDLGGNTLAAVLHQKADGSWESLNYKEADGKVIVTFTSLSPVVFVTTNAGTSGGDKSPETGDTTGVWAVVFVALLMGAGYCFVSARKASCN